MTAVLRVVAAERDDEPRDGRNGDTTDDPRDPQLYRNGIASARAALREGVARRHDRDRDELDVRQEEGA